MTPLSKRFALAALAVLVVAFAAATVGARATHHRDGCSDPSALAAPTHFDGLRPFERDASRESTTRPLWSQGRITLDVRNAPEFDVLVVRSYDPISLYLATENLLPMRAEPDKGVSEEVHTDAGLVPVRFLYAMSRNSALWRTEFLAYVFVYDDEPVASPFLAQMASAVPDLVNGRRPMTLLLVRGGVSNLYLAEAEHRARSWLIDAWKRYRETCSE